MSLDLASAISDALDFAYSILNPLIANFLPIILGVAFLGMLAGIVFGLPRLIGKVKLF